jgi:pyruvate/2-oxoglutarate dehydrogenase complex dihydrolipoamide dehydrogenase (E3) component
MSDQSHYDAIIIGAGQAGVPLARALANSGRRTALIEREHIGGTCVNEGCTPTKTMVASGRVAYLARRAADYGVEIGPMTINMATIRERKRAIVREWRGGSEESLGTTKNLDVLMGAARFTGPKTLEIALNDGGSRELSADLIFINVGLRPSIPKIDGLDSIDYLTSTSIMELASVPEHLVVLGGGYIGLEFAQLFRRLGSRVTIVQRGEQLLPREDPDIAEALATILREDGIDIRFKSEVARASKQQNEIELELKQGGKQETIVASHVLVATGRRPNSDALQLDLAGIETDDKGFIKVNDRLESSSQGVFALGDVHGGPAFTHISYDDFRIIRANLIEGKRASIKDRLLPYTVFTDPQLGRVGLSEKEAREQGYKIRVATLPMSSVARAREVDESRGLMKAIVDAESEQILGAAVLGIEGGEVASAIQMAMMGKLPYTALRDGVFSHPTLCESLNNLFMAMDA